MTCDELRRLARSRAAVLRHVATGLVLLGAVSACTQTEVVQVPVPAPATSSASEAPAPTPVATPPVQEQPTEDYYEQFAADIEQVRLTIGGKAHLCEVLTPDIATPSGYYCWAAAKGPMSEILRNETRYMHPDFYCPKNPEKACNPNPDQLQDPKGLRQGAPVVDAPPTEPSGLNAATCTFAGTPLYGSVYFTTSSGLADVSVYVSSSSGLADLNVYQVDYPGAADGCGLWYPTSSAGLADLTVYVTSSSGLADLTIHEVGYASAAGT